MKKHPFTRGRFRHDLCLDIDIEILKITHVGEDYVKAEILYINRNYDGGNMVLFQNAENVSLKAEQYKFWERV